MKPIRGLLILAGLGMAGCSLNFGTVGTWAAATPPPVSIQGTSSVVTSDGLTVFLGRFDLQSGQPLNQVLVFNPKANRWAEGSPIPTQGTGYSLVALSDGSVLLAGGGVSGPGGLPAAGGGGPAGGGLLATTWLYNPALDKWTRAGNLNVARSGASAVLLSDGKVLIAGGTIPLATPTQLPDGTTDWFAFSNSAEVFDPRTDSWSVVGSMHVARGGMALLQLPNGRALAAGGCPYANRGFSQGGALDSAEVFDPSSKAWSSTARLPQPRCGATGVTLRDGRALLTTGFFNSLQVTNSGAFVYDDVTHAWTTAGATVPGVSAPVLLPDGRVFAAAVQAGPVKGHVESMVLGGQIFDPSSNDWRFATSQSVLVASRFAPESEPTLVPRGSNGVMVILTAAGLAYSFDPAGRPPSALVLDSSGLALLLAAFAAALCLWLGLDYIRDRRRHLHAAGSTRVG